MGKEGNKRRFLRKGLSTQFLDELNFITKKKIIKWTEQIGFKEVHFSPDCSKTPQFEEINIVYPKGYTLPEVGSTPV